MNEITSIFKATHGVMTEEVGVISGELELTTACQEDGSLTLHLTYVGPWPWLFTSGRIC
ncbi:hypothetical protein [Exiguobacterium profundum]|uniref:hypothetical protein n=1 Tax=Exiguobacterium profundum TaxID=307643 RepID=UPI0035139A89